MTVLLAVAAAVLCASGTYLVLGRQLSRVVIGIGMMGHGANVLLIMSGGDGGSPPFVGGGSDGAAGGFADPLPQALALTAIVITFGVIAFLLALAYRSWRVTADDEVEDDVEDRLIARLDGRADAGSESP
jgi:multicomponent Na+:H+ antiporter subunit C